MNDNVMSFSGSSDDWDSWKFVFEAAAVTYGYDGILDGTESVPTKAEVKAFDPETKDASELKKLQLYKLNSLAMVHLIKSIDRKTTEGKVAFCILKKTASDDYPSGSAFFGFQKLNERYSSNSQISKNSLGKEFTNRRQRGTEDSNTFITELELLRFQRELVDPYFEMTDEAFCGEVLCRVTKRSYKDDIDEFSAKMSRKMNVTISDIRRRLAVCDEGIHY